MSANQVHLNASMDLLGVAGKQNFQKIISRGYLKALDETNEIEANLPQKKPCTYGKLLPQYLLYL